MTTLHPAHDPDNPPARPSATVVVVRDGVESLEILLLKRSSVGAFADMWVFPGGRVDDDEVGDDEQAKAASAAVREAREEVGLIVDRDSLIPLSHWIAPASAPKRFATWFFVAPWAGDEVVIDGHEIVEARWMPGPQADDGSLPMAPPTIVTIKALRNLRSLADLSAHVEANGFERFRTVALPYEGGLALLWHGDAGYEAVDPTLDGPRHRMILPPGSANFVGSHDYQRTT